MISNSGMGHKRCMSYSKTYKNNMDISKLEEVQHVSPSLWMFPMISKLIIIIIKLMKQP